MWTLNWIHCELIWKWCCLRFRFHSHMNEKTTVKNYFGIQQDVDTGTGEKCIHALNLNGYLHFLLASHISYVNRNFKFHSEREIHWFGSVHTAQRQTPTEILIGFCANLPLSVPVLVSGSVSTLIFERHLLAMTLNQHAGHSSAGLDTLTARFSSLLLKTKTSFPPTSCKARTSFVSRFSTKKMTPSGWFAYWNSSRIWNDENICCWLPTKCWNFSVKEVRFCNN